MTANSVSGGKVLHLPGVSELPSTKTAKVKKVSGTYTPSRQEWWLISVGLLVAVLLPVVVYLVVGPAALKKSDAEHKAIDPTSLGFDLGSNAALDASWQLSGAVFVAFLIGTGVMLSRINTHMTKKSENIFAAMVGLTFILLFGQGYVFHQSPLYQYSMNPAISEWAETKYDLEAIEYYNSDKPQDELKARKNDGSIITMKIYRDGNKIYLYQTADELQSILSEIAAASK